MKIGYRKACLDDAYAIRYIGAYSWKEAYTGLVPENYLDYRIDHFEEKVDKQKELMKSKDNTFYVADVDGETVGFVSYGKAPYEKYKDYGYVGALYLLKKYQKLGIGKELLRIALEGLKEEGYTDMMLECMTGNKTVDFYKKYLGEIVETIDYPLNGGFSVKADIMLFNIDASLKAISNNKTL